MFIMFLCLLRVLCILFWWVYFALNGYVNNWKSKYLMLEKGISSGLHELKMTDLVQFCQLLVHHYSEMINVADQDFICPYCRMKQLA